MLRHEDVEEHCVNVINVRCPTEFLLLWLLLLQNQLLHRLWLLYLLLLLLLQPHVLHM